MSRPSIVKNAVLLALPAVVAIAVTTSTAEAGWPKSINLQKGINIANQISGQHRIRPIAPPVHPPIVRPPVCRPIVHPPIQRPIHPPVCVHPTPRPIIIERPAPAPIVIERPAPTTAFRPISFPSPQPTVVPTRTWYFGVSLQITNTAYGRGLQIANLTPGGPAALAGLEVGDVLMVANGQSLQNANTNEHGVQILQSLVDPMQGQVQIGVLDVRTNQPTYLSVMPQRVGGGPAPTSTFPQFPGQQFPAAPSAPAMSSPVASTAAPARAF